MTTEDKNWLYIGVGLLATGGAIYWYKNKDNSKEIEGFERLESGTYLVNICVNSVCKTIKVLKHEV